MVDPIVPASLAVYWLATRFLHALRLTHPRALRFKSCSFPQILFLAHLFLTLSLESWIKTLYSRYSSASSQQYFRFLEYGLLGDLHVVCRSSFSVKSTLLTVPLGGRNQRQRFDACVLPSQDDFKHPGAPYILGRRRMMIVEDTRYTLACPASMARMTSAHHDAFWAC